MVWFDFIILAIILVSALVSILRGFVREALSLAGWVVAVFGALRLAPVVAPWLSASIKDDSILSIVSLIIAFAILLVATSLLNMLLIRLFRVSGLTGADRTLGALFGVVRGALVVAVVVMVAEWTTVVERPWWRQSTLVPYFQVVSHQLRELIPKSAAYAPALTTLGKLAE